MQALFLSSLPEASIEGHHVNRVIQCILPSRGSAQVDGIIASKTVFPCSRLGSVQKLICDRKSYQVRPIFAKQVAACLCFFPL